MSKKEIKGALILAPIAAICLVITRLADLIQSDPLEGIPLAAIVVALVGLAVYVWMRIRAQRNRALRAIGFAGIDRMSGREFESHLVHVFKHHGYRVRHMGKPGDQGADMILWRGGEKIACQLKRSAKDISNKAVQEAVTAREYYGCDHAMVVTNRFFTKGARDVAEKTGCQLIDREQLGAMVTSFQTSGGTSPVTSRSNFGETRYTIRVTKID